MYPYNNPGNGQPLNYPTNIPTQSNPYQQTPPPNSYNQPYQSTPQQSGYGLTAQQYHYHQPGSQDSYQQSTSTSCTQQFSQGTYPTTNSQGTYPTINSQGTYPTINSQGTYPTMNSQGTNPTMNSQGTYQQQTTDYYPSQGNDSKTNLEIDSSKVKIVLSVENIDRDLVSYIQNLSGKITVDPTTSTFILSDLTGICQMEGKETTFRIQTAQGAFEKRENSSLNSFNMAEQEFDGPDDSPAQPIPDFQHNTPNSYEQPQPTFNNTITPPYQPPPMDDSPY